MPTAADTLDEIRARGWFTWGADEEGGGPYVYTDPDDPNRRVGFEVDLAAALAEELSAALGTKIEARFSQGQWDRLPDLLGTGRIDLVLNGYEWTPERCEVMAPSLPYYAYELQLLTRADDRNISSWESLRAPSGQKVGVLGGSAAERYLRAQFPEVEIVNYDGNTNALSDVAQGRLAATVQDLPIAVFYRRQFPGLQFLGAPVEPGRYVIYVRPEEVAFLREINQGISSLRKKGKLRAILERYGIWTSSQEDPRLAALPEPSADTEVARGDPGSGYLRRNLGTLLQAAGMTILLSVLSFPLAIALGILVALGRLFGPRLLSLVLAVYVEVLRGTPLMLQLFVLFYVLPRVGVSLDPLVAGILGLAVNYSAYEAEIYRAGLQAVPRGQLEAALALGMTRALAIRRIILPQAVRIVLPPVTNDFIALFKDTSVCSVITVVELTKRYNILAMTSPSQVVPLAATAAVLYLIMSYPLSLLSRWLERRLEA